MVRKLDYFKIMKAIALTAICYTFMVLFIGLA